MVLSTGGLNSLGPRILTHERGLQGPRQGAYGIVPRSRVTILGPSEFSSPMDKSIFHVCKWAGQISCLTVYVESTELQQTVVACAPWHAK